MTDIIHNLEETLYERLLQGAPFMQVLLGPRQVGKTTIVKQVMKRWHGTAIYSSADLPTPPQNSWIQEHWNQARSALRANPESAVLLVLDEVQKVERWSEVVKSLYETDRHTQLRIVLLGSASLALHSGLTESLLGRYEVMRVPHWGYAETKNRFNWDLQTFMKFGGYPAPAVLINDPERWRLFINDSIIEAILSRDIALLKDISKPALFRQTLALAMRYPGAIISYDKFIGQLQDKGNATTVKSYLDTLSKAFLIAIIEKYSTRALSSKASSPKLIPLCPALISAFGDPMRIEREADWFGAVFESIIGAHLNYLFKDKLFYWRERNVEVDFVVEDDSAIYAVEVKSNRRKPLGALKTFQDTFSANEKKVFTLTIDQPLALELLLINKRSEALHLFQSIAT